ncbi:SpoIIE family protein phosphatase [Pasteuria penetrans]|uniref:SpoIIE family protein phosphatase n=1 Tax=Pasteuria penetrans TaxID=86005 RepID=UPI000F9FEF9F|nr:SpoIIE family protein phosphatase [Pasteuria penetrans]
MGLVWSRLGLGHGRLRGSWTVLGIFLAGVSLGRAELLGTLSPFALPYAMAVFGVARTFYWPTVLGSVLGALLGSPLQGKQWLSLGLLVLIGLGWERCTHGPLRFPMVWVGFASIFSYGVLWLVEGGVRGQDLALALVDSMLSALLVPVFMRAIPLFTAGRRRLLIRPEMTLACLFFLAAVVSGAAHWGFWGVRVSDWLAHGLTAMVAWGGGGLWGSAFGTLVVSFLYLVGGPTSFFFPSLPLAGLLAGLLWTGSRRRGVLCCFGLSALWDVFLHAETVPLLPMLLTVGLALFFLLLVPARWPDQLASIIPGTVVQESVQQDYLRRLRDVTAERVEKFVQVFQELAHSFGGGKERITKTGGQGQPLLADLASSIAEGVCPGCPKQAVCWDSHVETTCNELGKMIPLLSRSGGNAMPTVAWRKYCVRPQPTANVLRDVYTHRVVRERSDAREMAVRQLVRDQLSGMAEVMDNLAKEIRGGVCAAEACEEKLSGALIAGGIPMERLDVINLQPGRIELEITLLQQGAKGVGKRWIAPLLSQVLGEPVHLLRHASCGDGRGALLSFGSAQRYRLRIGHAMVVKEGKTVSGDSSCALDLGTGKFALAVSDGMGHGEKAREESQSALRLLRRLLRVGIAPLVAVQTVNTVLRLRASDEEMFTTVDLVLVDLYTASGQFLKIGSAPGFVKRDQEVHRLRASHPPIGILPTLDIEPLHVELESGDLVILMTDGVYDAMEDAAWLHCLRNAAIPDPQNFADSLLEAAWDRRGHEAKDDMTVVVAKVERCVGEWSTVRFPGVASVRRSV